MDFIPHNRWVNRPEYEVAALRVLRSGHVAQGREVAAFEEELAARFRPSGACAVVSSGTVALRLAFEVTWYPDTIPTYACSALYHAAELPEYNLDVLDCEPDTFNTPNADVVVHTYGVPARVPEDKIEDFTHAPGASLDGKPCGSFGMLSVISFGATKPLGIGMGGAVLGSPGAIEAIKDIRDYDGKADLLAGLAFNRQNYQLGDMYAAIGRERLKRLDEEYDWRNRTGYRYWVSTPFGIVVHDLRLSASSMTPTGFLGQRCWYRYIVRVKDVSAAIEHFAKADIEVINPLRTEELIHRRLGFNPKEFPNAEAAAASTISLPIWPGMSDEEVRRVADALAELK